MKSDKELYRGLRVLSCEKLWSDEVARFESSTPGERIKRVAVIRAVAVVFSKSGTAKQRAEAKSWLIRLLQDPSEKVRRYAITALPKLGAGKKEEGALLSLLGTTTVDREKKILGQALDKIGGTATLNVVAGTPGFLPQTEQKVKANVARSERPSVIRMDSILSDFTRLRIHLHIRVTLLDPKRSLTLPWEGEFVSPTCGDCLGIFLPWLLRCLSLADGLYLPTHCASNPWMRHSN